MRAAVAKWPLRGARVRERAATPVRRCHALSLARRAPPDALRARPQPEEQRGSGGEEAPTSCTAASPRRVGERRAARGARAALLRRLCAPRCHAGRPREARKALLARDLGAGAGGRAPGLRALRSGACLSAGRVRGGFSARSARARTAGAALFSAPARATHAPLASRGAAGRAAQRASHAARPSAWSQQNLRPAAAGRPRAGADAPPARAQSRQRARQPPALAGPVQWRRRRRRGPARTAAAAAPRAPARHPAAACARRGTAARAARAAAAAARRAWRRRAGGTACAHARCGRCRPACSRRGGPRLRCCAGTARSSLQRRQRRSRCTVK